MKDMVIIVPTRSAGGVRVKTLERLVQSWYNYREHSDLVVIIDEDDVIPYNDLISSERFHVEIVPRMSYCEKLNHVVGNYTTDYDIIGHLSDDHTFNSVFEKPISDFIEERGMGVCYGNDLLQGENLPTAPFISSNIIRGLGFMCLPGLKHMYVDNFWKDLGIRLNCLRYFPDIITEHLHWSAGKAPSDDQYKEVHALMERDGTIFNEYRNHQMQVDIERVKEYIQKPVSEDEQKTLYQQLENEIIKWSIDGTKTAGALTRKIMDLVVKEKRKNSNSKT